MIALAGFGGILLALAAAGWLVVEGVRVARRPELGKRRLARPAAGLLAGAVVAMGALELALVVDDFSIRYLAEHHSRSTPFPFDLATAWAALEGSIVLWGLVLAAYTWSVGRRVTDGDRLGAGALAVMGAVAVFFFGLMATIANPFETVPNPPLDGPGPNPLLQNHILMAIHPPLLYLGFVGFTVPFAFAFSALSLGEGGAVWLERTRRWSLVAWTFLTAGILLGAWWSYEVLGWGGYWAWDPVENASILPWLVGTAFIHSAVVQERRGMLQAWNVALVLATFALTIFGTFLTRSGVVASVHSFTQSSIGPAFLAFLVLVVVASYGLFALRAHRFASVPRLESLASREGVFLFNNLLLTVFALTVLTGTMYPVLVEAFTGVQVSVGRPFFDRMAVPLSFALLLAMGIGPVTPYRVARPAVVWERIRNPLRVALGAGALLVVLGIRTPYVVLAVLLAVFVAATILRTLAVTARKMAAARDLPLPEAVLRVMRNDHRYWGGQISHLGVALVALAIAVSGNLAVRDSLTLSPGDQAAFAGYEIAYRTPFTRQEPNRTVVGARVELLRGDRPVALLEPRLNEYRGRNQTVSTPAVHTGLRGDVYLTLSAIDGGLVTLEARAFPLMYLLWAGGLVVALGGVWARWAGRPARAPTPVSSRA